MAGEYDVRLYNIVTLGLGFMFLFSAFQTCAMAQGAVLKNIKDFSGNGLVSLSIIYVVFAFSNWIAPPIVAVLGPKITMIVGGLCYLLFIMSFLKPMTWALYTASALVGIGAAILWTAQGNFLTINSDSNTVTRNSGIFWALLQCSLLFGNMYSYFVLKGTQKIDSSERTKLYLGLTGAAALGIITLLFLRKGNSSSGSLVTLNVSERSETETPISLNASRKETPVDSLKRSFSLFFTREMLILSLVFAYTGFELTFFSGVYGFCISNNGHFGSDSNGLIGISGMLIGAGEILGGAAFGLFGKRTNKYGRDPIVLLGYIVHMVAFFLIFINLPEKTPLEKTFENTFLESNKYIAILCSFLLGFGDASFNTQLYSLLGAMFPEDSSPAFALFKFMQSVAAAIGFFYSTHLILQWQLLILVITGNIAVIAFFVVEWGASRALREGYQAIGSWQNLAEQANIMATKSYFASSDDNESNEENNEESDV